MACGARCKTQFYNETMNHPVFAKQKWPRIFTMPFFHIDQTAKKSYIFTNPLRLRMKFPFDHKENIQDEKV